LSASDHVCQAGGPIEVLVIVAGPAVGVRVPFIARWPEHIPAAKTEKGPAITMDLLPTILDAAKITPSAADYEHPWEIHGSHERR